MSTPTATSRRRAREIAAYDPPKSSRPIDLHLDANEGRHPPAELLESLASRGVTSFSRYPTTTELEAQLARRLEVAPSELVVTGGGDDALDRICRAFLAPGRSAIVTTPTFEMIPRAARTAGASVTELPWLAGAFPTDRVVAALDETTSVIFVVTPNNPTGSIATGEDIRTISRAAPDAIVCVDLAYTEYADADLTPDALSFPNVVIVRTLSKAWGLAGLRIGYAAGPGDIVRAVRSAGAPYPVAGPSLAAASAWLGAGASYVRESIATTRAERAALTAALRDMGLEALDSQANFVLARSPDAWGIAERLAEGGIGVRRFARPGPFAEYLRITCPCNAADFARLLRALSAAVAGVEEVRP